VAKKRIKEERYGKKEKIKKENKKIIRKRQV
jgi:hypothetical protein